MLSGAMAAQRCLILSPDVQTVTLKSRNAGETGETDYSWQAQEQPATQADMILSGAVVGENWKILEFFVQTQTVMPKELDQWTDNTGRYTIHSITVELARNVYRCRGLFAAPS